ncbi:conserved hypothetical protein [Solidesulfovibrio fructosivorans JJ]]|uniref:Uncharacterized protein n=1 Tax=Solidesulfovibrio fructosivorans JJ] TaxID=596151 RepID=E1K0G4_SOLFR|nr:hypothetical protein [Solidesulfovibrio fructosivorans]EFL49907.1 conserved hypothetical protein [Solidesulfovibrio fructosivorans JJ]]
MSKREKILLAAVCVTAVLGLWITLDRPSRQTAPKPASGDAAQAANMLRAIKDSDLSPATISLVSAIGRKWPATAFYDKPLSGRGPVQHAVLPRYSGYVELGSGKLAVLDGMEYQAGDALEGGGYKVVSIAPDQVVLESLANGQQVTIPYEGQDARQGR